ncbi:MAG: hypothetical protein L0G70_07150 [Rubrobacter sp.]|nr:hypothetical protein [Rubrobacter sp.]
MSEERVLPVRVKFAGIGSRVIHTSYVHSNTTALLLVDAADDSLVITASINVAGVSESLPEDQLVLKTYSEGEGLLEALGEAGVVEDTGERVASGFVECPIVRLTV